MTKLKIKAIEKKYPILAEVRRAFELAQAEWATFRARYPHNKFVNKSKVNNAYNAYLTLYQKAREMVDGKIFEKYGEVLDDIKGNAITA